MTKYVPRDQVLEIIKRTSGDYAAAWAEVNKLPAADVAPVVRCKDCKYHRENDCFHFCKRMGVYCPDDSEFFCSYGEYQTNAGGTANG